MHNQLDVDRANPMGQRKPPAIRWFGFLLRYFVLLISLIVLLYAVFARPMGVPIGLRLVVALLLVFTVVLLMIFRTGSRQLYWTNQRRQARLHALVYNASRDIPNWEPTFNLRHWPWQHITGRLLLALLVLPFVFIPVGLGTLLLVRLVWPGVPAWLSMVVSLVAVFVGWPFMRRRKEARTPEAAEVFRSELTLNALLVLVFVLCWGVIRLFDEALKVLLGIRVVLSIALLFLIPTYILLIGWTVQVLPAMWIQHALDRANYEEALRRIGMLRRWFPHSPSLLLLEGKTQMLAGRLQEAEMVLQECLVRQSKRFANAADTLESLGYVLMWQGRYDEAIRAFENAIQIQPDGTEAYSGLAQVYLEQNTNVELALMLTERALLNQQGSAVNRHGTAQGLAMRAWALAAQGEREQALQTANDALGQADFRFKPGLAGIYYRLAQAIQVLGDTVEMIAYLREAAAIDPTGIYGDMAAQQLAEVSEWQRHSDGDSANREKSGSGEEKV